eukprot:958218-Rhodomonas_salina.1
MVLGCVVQGHGTTHLKQTPQDKPCAHTEAHEGHGPVPLVATCARSVPGCALGLIAAYARPLQETAFLLGPHPCSVAASTPRTTLKHIASYRISLPDSA